jgi:hypothetical protein
LGRLGCARGIETRPAGDFAHRARNDRGPGARTPAPLRAWARLGQAGLRPRWRCGAGGSRRLWLGRRRGGGAGRLRTICSAVSAPNWHGWARAASPVSGLITPRLARPSGSVGCGGLERPPRRRAAACDVQPEAPLAGLPPARGQHCLPCDVRRARLGRGELHGRDPSSHGAGVEASLRALHHGVAKGACTPVRRLEFPTAVVEFADAFVLLQDKRQAADHDPMAAFSRPEVLTLIGRRRGPLPASGMPRSRTAGPSRGPRPPAAVPSTATPARLPASPPC